MFRSQESIQNLLQKPNANLTSRLVNVVIVLMMINLAFYFAIDPFFETQFGNYKWIFVLLLPPVQYFLQRFLFVLTSRLGLLMFAADRLPVDPIERKAKWNLLKKYYPYTYYPTAVLSVLAAPLSTSFFLIFLVFLGLIYMYLLRVQLLKEVFGVSGAVAFWGPLLVELLISFVLTVIVFVISFLVITLFNIPLAP
ncbi:hypothetical protein CBW65_12410 [Tumebacillus avium]|uniref:Yip1 domain-containing protein n=2 Tax=Tumebacillus avium TaxID=1903704 RepID=A0A1Y0IMI9_9BACL|nr:hypothetical protein CBW65_12410 [Tumebacillus avium]